MELLNINDIPNFRTLSYRSLRIYWHYINSSIIDMINPDNDNAAVDSSIVKTCRDTNAHMRRKNKKYRDPESSWGTAQWATNTKGACFNRCRFIIHNGMEDNHRICI
ncbi:MULTISPECIES: hypothetical protein [Acidiplasma]|jgi:hypothetical protein|uniref:Transposase n=1 Tax=Acidiplasma cupricumulans TaxID=312540 RepID=A0A0Q1B4H4_9ARCH|nr:MULTISPECIES: hypothetical protein [Acidiplasma]KQB34838.1 hypothetical protein AOG55_08935 [Acidiplasma cupricumulans]